MRHSSGVVVCVHRHMTKRLPSLLLTLVLSANPVSAQNSTVPARFSKDAFADWYGADAQRQVQYEAFQVFLKQNGVADVIPAYQLWRTSSSSAQCKTDAFVVPDRAHWPHIVTTLRFVRDQVQPAIGSVEAVSGYRNELLNTCSGGAKRSAHRTYYALDIVPLRPDLDRPTLIKRMCAVHARNGAQYTIGLGFYSARRFHVDSLRFRRWGPDGTGKTSPCNTKP
jgi:hypothetical protein